MKKSQFILISIGAVCLLSLALYISILKFGVTKSKETMLSSSLLQAITMKDAIAMAYTGAHRWSKYAKLIDITSTDKDDNPDSYSGRFGKRVSWNLIFTNFNSTSNINSTPSSYNIFISNGKIVSSRQIMFGNHEEIKDSDLVLDSDNAVSIAKSVGLMPGKSWAIGYHFNMQYLPYGNSGQNRLIIEVFGLSPKGNFAHVDIDEKTGKIVDALEKTYDTGGNATWKEF